MLPVTKLRTTNLIGKKYMKIYDKNLLCISYKYMYSLYILNYKFKKLYLIFYIYSTPPLILFLPCIFYFKMVIS